MAVQCCSCGKYGSGIICNECSDNIEKVNLRSKIQTFREENSLLHDLIEYVLLQEDLMNCEAFEKVKTTYSNIQKDYRNNGQ